MITGKILRCLGCFSLLVLLLSGCETSLRREQKMQEVMGEYELVQPDDGYIIPDDLYEANKTARVLQSGDRYVLEVKLPRLKQEKYVFFPFSLTVHYNQVLGDYVVTPPSEDEIKKAEIFSHYMREIALDPTGFKIEKYIWRKR
jgi:uncharacterized lipoprotein